MAIPVEKRVAIAVWFLATPGEYRTIGHLFGVARCTVCVIVREVCRAIERVLRPRYISFPNNDRIQTIIQGFETEWGVPQCVGAIDGSHIPILAPNISHTALHPSQNLNPSSLMLYDHTHGNSSWIYLTAPAHHLAPKFLTV